MLILSETEEFLNSLPIDDAKMSVKSTCVVESSPESHDGLRSASELHHSPSVPTLGADVSVVPEHLKTDVESLVSNLEGEIQQLKIKQRSLDKKRRDAFNKILDIRGSIRVFCRVRPLLLAEKRRIHEPILIGEEIVAVKSAGSRKEYGFNKVFHQGANQEDVFVEVEPILRSALDGHNVCVLAYGQTGTGKTFTMDGTNDRPGIVPRSLEQLFHQASLENTYSITFSISMLEIHMGNLKDLLAPRQAFRAYEAVTKCNLNIQTDSKGFVEIEGLTEVPISDAAKARWWYNKGRRYRSTSWTNVNEASSRSHCLTRVTVFRRGDTEARGEVSKLWMIDLGGSERLLKTGATGQTLDEGKAINLSLSAFGDVIAALRRKKRHVPYRNSKLTQILKDSLGNGSKVLMLLHISPNEEDVAETICALNFTKRARSVESIKELPEDIKQQQENRIAELEVAMKEAEEESQKVRNQLQNATLLLSENKKIFTTTYPPLDLQVNNSPESLEELKNEVTTAPQKAKKPVKQNSPTFVPRFMTSTAASRLRQNGSETEIVGRATSLRSGSRSSLQISTSQSLSLSDTRFRALLKKKILPTYGNNDLASKTDPTPRSKMVSCSDPNLRFTFSRHRRRMSDLI